MNIKRVCKYWRSFSISSWIFSSRMRYCLSAVSALVWNSSMSSPIYRFWAWIKWFSFVVLSSVFSVISRSLVARHELRYYWSLMSSAITLQTLPNAISVHSIASLSGNGMFRHESISIYCIRKSLGNLYFASAILSLNTDQSHMPIKSKSSLFISGYRILSPSSIFALEYSYFIATLA